MTTTVVTCHKCGHAVFANALIGSINISDASHDSPDTHYMLMTCLHCNQQQQYVVDLQPEFSRA